MFVLGFLTAQETYCSAALLLPALWSTVCALLSLNHKVRIKCKNHICRVKCTKVLTTTTFRSWKRFMINFWDKCTLHENKFEGFKNVQFLELEREFQWYRLGLNEVTYETLKGVALPFTVLRFCTLEILVVSHASLVIWCYCWLPQCCWSWSRSLKRVQDTHPGLAASQLSCAMYQTKKFPVYIEGNDAFNK